MTRPAPASRLLLAVATGLALLADPPSVAAGWPPSQSGYHDEAELVAEIHAVEASRPDIVDVFAIGTSHQGRPLWTAKVSDNVTLDEDEPEVLFDALHHGREHLTLEQALDLFHLLVDGHGVDPRITALVDSREVWIVFAVNPDGAAYDLTGSPYRAWRKNRQPAPGGVAIGTDLNRNYDYRWACCGGSSSDPRAPTYRGPRPFSAPETRAVRDFVASRVVGGRQQIRAHVTFHTNGELILWPYGYTRLDVPPDMTRADHAAFVALARAMAARNGYRAIQSSDLYITDGDQIDWLYARYRIFSFTFELYPPEQPTVWGDHYPPDEVIGRETARNREALLYLLEVADCPYRASGTERLNCGPLYDDFEIGRGWRVDPFGTDTATAGRWHRGDPAPTWSSGPKQVGTAISGSLALVTGSSASAGPDANDVDGGTTTVASPAVLLPAEVGRLTFRYYLAHDVRASLEDSLEVSVEDLESGVRKLVFRELGGPSDDDAVWGRAWIDLRPWAGRSIRIVAAVGDRGADSLVEAAIDDVRILRPA